MIKKRNTKTKELVRSVFETTDRALTHEDIEKALDGQMDRVTIYRILQGFEEDGLVHKIADESGKWHYATCRGCSGEHHNDNHIHFYCVACQTISCLDTPVSQPKLPAGYSIKDITYLISGNCPDCH